MDRRETLTCVCEMAGWDDDALEACFSRSRTLEAMRDNVAQLRAEVGALAESIAGKLQVVDDRFIPHETETRRRLESLEQGLQKAVPDDASTIGLRMEEFKRELLNVGRTAEEAGHNCVQRISLAEGEMARLRRELSDIESKTVRTGAQAVEQAAHNNTEQLFLEIRELRSWVEFRFEEAENQQKSLFEQAKLAWEAACERHFATARHELTEEVGGLRADVETDIQRLAVQWELREEAEKALEQRTNESMATIKAQVLASDAAWRDALVSLRHSDLRSLGTSLAQLRKATGSLGAGVLRVAQVIGILPAGDALDRQVVSAGSRQRLGSADAGGQGTAWQPDIIDAEDILTWEISGHSVSARLSEAWACFADHGQSTFLEYVQHRSEQAARRILQSELGDIDLRIRKVWEDCFPPGAAIAPPHTLTTRLQEHRVDALELARQSRKEFGKKDSPLGVGGQVDLQNSSLPWSCATAKLPRGVPLRTTAERQLQGL